MNKIIKKVISICFLLLIVISFSGCASKNEGLVRIDDCREIISLKNDSLEKIYKDFTCNYSKTSNGKIISGECVSIEMEGNNCKKAFIYDVEPEVKCPENMYVGYDDLCHSY